MEALWQYADDLVRGFLYPPTPEDRVREGRSDLRRQARRLAREQEKVQRELDALMQAARARASAGMDEAALRESLREAAGRRAVLREVAAALRQIWAADSRLATASATGAVRDSIRVMADALGASAEGGSEAVTADMQLMMRQQHAADSVREAVTDVISAEDCDEDFDSTLDALVAEVRCSTEEQLPSVPTTAPLRGRPPTDPPALFEDSILRRMEALRDDRRQDAAALHAASTSAAAQSAHAPADSARAALETRKAPPARDGT
jgi:hypothetical protein